MAAESKAGHGNGQLKATYEEVEGLFGQVPSWMKEMPDSAIIGYWTVFRDFNLGETSIPNKYKELIGIAVSGAIKCRYCSLFHTESARLYGATDEEIAEAAFMAGTTTLGSTFLNGAQVDYEEFGKQTREMIEYARQHQAQPGGSAEQAGASAHV